MFFEDDGSAEQLPTATYDYRDEQNQILFQVVRYPGKRFAQRRPGPLDGSWSWSLGDVRRVPYRLPELLASSGLVYVVEGEKDAEAVVRAGGVATCAAGGAGRSSWKEEWAPFFRGRHVIVVADDDDPGRQYAGLVAARLRGSAASVRIVQAKIGKDAADHLGAGHTLDEFISLVDEGAPPAILIKVTSWEDFRESSQETPEMLVEGLWSAGAFGFIAGAPKARKTWFGLGMGLALASGQPFLGWDVPEPVDVLYMALEGSRGSIRTRIGALMRGYQIDPDRSLDKFHLAYRPPNMDLMRVECAENLRHIAHQTDAKIIFVDVLRAATVFDENSASDFSKLMHNLRPLLNDGISIAMLHHFGKWGDTNSNRDPGDRMVGTGAMRGALDVGLYLTQVGGTTRVDSEARDLNMPDTFQWSLSGFGSGPNGGFTYRDTCQLKLENGESMEKRLATAVDIATWIRNNGGSATPRVICGVFGINDAAFRALSNDLAKHGILPRGKGISVKWEAVSQMGMAG